MKMTKIDYIAISIMVMFGIRLANAFLVSNSFMEMAMEVIKLLVAVCIIASALESLGD